MILSARQRLLIETLEKTCRLEAETLNDYTTTIKALEDSPKEECSREVLTRMIHCIWDNSVMPDELNPAVKNLCRACQKYAFKLGSTKEEGYLIGLEEVIKTAPEMLVQSRLYFGSEILLGYLKILADEKQYHKFLNSIVWTLFSLPFNKRDAIIKFISNAADRLGRENGCSSQETVIGIILTRIMDSMSLYGTQNELITILERAAKKMETETNGELYYNEMGTYFAAMTAIDYSPRHQRCREALARMIRCIIDGQDLNPMFATCCGICDSYALSLSESKTEGYSIALQEAIKAAPERLSISPVYFGGEFFQGYINFLYRDSDFEVYLEAALTAFQSLPPDQRNYLLSHIWSLAENDSERRGFDPNETQYGIIHNRITQGLKTV